MNLRKNTRNFNKHERDKKRARSTWANFDFGHRLFLLRPVLLRLGATLAVQLRPILACLFDHPKCQDEKNKKIKRNRNGMAGQST